MSLWHPFDADARHNENVARRPAYRNVLRFRQRRQKAEGEHQGKIAVVLSGGGNRGVAQVGMLRALVEAGIRPDVVVGTSVGALNGAAFARDLCFFNVTAPNEVYTLSLHDALPI